MEKSTKIQRTAKCANCGQMLGYEVKNQKIKISKIKCPICKKYSWCLNDNLEQCILKLAQYELTGYSPGQIYALLDFLRYVHSDEEMKRKYEEWNEQAKKEIEKKRSISNL